MLPQVLLIHSEARRESAMGSLKALDVRNSEASFPADKDFVLAKVDDFDAFNNQVRGLVLSQLDSFLTASVLETLIDDFASVMFEMIVG